jgi:uncharacterized membrane protein
MNEIVKNDPIATTKVIYILLMVSTLIGLSGVIAVIMAYIYRDGSTDWLQSHYQFQIRTFWIGLLYACIGLFTFAIVIGYFILLFTVVWVIIRCIKGLKQLDNRQPVNNVSSWMFT